MKRILTMKTVKTVGLGVFILAMFVSLACEQPFRAGLGAVIDTRPPTVRLDSPGAGEFIWGITEFRGFAEDDYKLDSVWIKITNHPDIIYRHNGEEIQPGEYFKTYMVSSSNGNWNIDIDTSQFPEGDFKIQIIAYDSVGKTAETDEIAFYVKNAPPGISMAMPYIPRSQASNAKEGEVGGPHLNYKIPPDKLNSIGVGYQRTMDKGTFLAGSISDDDDIYIGSWDKVNNRFPPQIRMWAISETTAGDTNEEGYLFVRPGELPPLTDVDWQSFELDTELFMLGIGNYQFIKEIPGEIAYYGFEVRAQSRDGRTEFRYPRDYWSDEAWNSFSDDQQKENSYVMIYIRSPREFPTLDLYGREDILHLWNNTEGVVEWGGAPLTEDRAPTIPHPYVDQTNVSKNGKFVLRVAAAHSEGIGSTEIYWEKEGTNLRGRFIWDWDPAWANSVPNWYADQYFNVNQQNYSFWGYRVPHTDGTRNYIFSYDPGNNTVPAAYYGVGGRSKIQQYTGVGSGEDWREAKKAGTLPENTSLFSDVPNGILEEGVYNIEIYTRSSYGTALPTPLSLTIRLDSTPPELEVTNIEGVVEQTLSDNEERNYATVNGVIRPRVVISDSRSSDSGLRAKDNTSGDYFAAYEQFFIVVHNDEKETFEGATFNVDKNWWPAFSSSSMVAPIPGIKKDGRVEGGTFKFKTSPIYGTLGEDYESDCILEPDALRDGDYWLYVFARDNAFNVGHSVPVKIMVKHETDWPVFTFGSINNLDYDDPNVDAGLNTIGANTTIRLTISDDDGLDLGVGGASSGIYMTFAGSEVDGTTHAITALSSPHIVDVKNLFGSLNEAGQVVKQRSLIITHQLMLSWLGITGRSALPDGMYQFYISVKDNTDPNVKLIMKDGDNPAEVAVSEKTFWFMVDTAEPSIIEIKPPGPEPESGDVGPDNVYSFPIIITVRDGNGPIKAAEESSFVRRLGGLLVDGGELSLTGEFQSYNPIDGWEYKFTGDVELGVNPGGTYLVTMGFTDRSGKTAEITVNYSIDREPPVVSIQRNEMIPTFERNEPDVGAPDDQGKTLSGENKKILATGILPFNVRATDNVAVSALRWWLIPQGSALPALISNIENFISTDYSAGYANSGLISGASINFNSSANVQYVDLRSLADGEWELHAVAIDSSGNLSANSLLQTIYVLKEEDKPYFGKIVPSEGVAVNSMNLFIGGTIFDDNGFADASGNAIRGSVKIWLSDEDGLINRTDDAYIAVHYPQSAEVPVNQLGILGKNLNLNNISLVSLFGYDFFEKDATFHYILEATDSFYQKYVTTTGGIKGTVNNYPDTSGLVSASRRKYFTFNVDARDPLIKLIHPDTALTQQFGPRAADDMPEAAASFYLEGEIADANLATRNGSPYIKYRVNTNPTEILELEAYRTGTITLAYGDGTTAPGIHFRIPADEFTKEIKFFDLASGTHQLTLIVEDTANHSADLTITFGKDSDPPAISFDEINAVVLPQNWNVRSEMEKRQWLLGDRAFPGYSEYTEDPLDFGNSSVETFRGKTGTSESQLQLSVLHWEGTPPTLKGTFSDDFSPIITDSLMYSIDGGAWVYLPHSSGGIINTSVSWEISLAGLSPYLKDGIHYVQFRVKDEPGNPFPWVAPYGFRLNSAPPALSINSPFDDVFVYGNRPGTIFSTNVTARSANLSGVRLEVRYVDDRNPANNRSKSWEIPVDVAHIGGLTFDDTIEQFIWTEDISRNDLLAAAGQTGTILLQGYYELAVVSTDLTGAESNEAVRRFIIDRTSPTFDFNDLNTTPAANNDLSPGSWQADINSRNVIRGTPRIQGRVQDEYSNLDQVQQQIRRYVYGRGDTPNGRWQYWRFTAPAGWQTQAPGTVDYDNNYWGNVAPRGSFDRQEYQIDWDLSALVQADGYYSVRFRAKDSANLNGTTAADWAGGTDGNPGFSPYIYFFYTRTDASFEWTAPVDSHFSSQGNPYTFGGTATSTNGFVKLDLEVERVNTASALPAVQSVSYNPPATHVVIPGTWSWSVPVPTAGLSDGSYRIRLTLTDLAGRTSSETRVIALDNTPPTGAFELPMAIASPFKTPPAGLPPDYTAGEIIFGGDNAIIEGTSADNGPLGSASGVAEIWYHFGYIGTGASETSLNFPIQTQIANSFTGVEGQNAWFKYGSVSAAGVFSPGLTLPTDDFKIDTNDVYGWSLSIEGEGVPGINGLADAGFQFKDLPTVYNTSGGQWLVQRIDGKYEIQDNIVKTGLYSLPLWIRVVDRAGNASYFYRDIWLYPNGDYPDFTFINPAANTDLNTPRGGMVSIEGSASDNKSIKNVIYRVWVDNNTNMNADRPAHLVSKVAGTDLQAAANGGDPDARKMEDFLIDPKVGETAVGWYMADPDSPGAAKNMPYSFRINENDEFIGSNGYIAQFGFNGVGSGGENDTIRVYVEVFAFDGEKEDGIDYNKMSLGPGGDEEHPKPYVRIFYLKNTSPKVSDQKISVKSLNNTDDFIIYRPGEVRGGQFAIQAFLENGGGIIRDIRVRRQGETLDGNVGWITVWDRLQTPPHTITDHRLPGITLTSESTGMLLNYKFDSLLSDAPAAGAPFERVRGGNWAASGGRFTIDISIRDDQNPPGQAEYTFEIGIDNFAPVADDDKIVTPGKTAGSSAAFFGRVFDYTGVTSAANSTAPYSFSKIETIYAWFTKGNAHDAQHINLLNRQNPQTVDDVITRSAWTGRDVEVTYDAQQVRVSSIGAVGGSFVPEIKYPRPSIDGEGREVSNGWVKVINERNSGMQGTGMTWQPTEDRDIYWNFTADTTLMPDGPMWLNYLVVDSAGNASLFQRRIVVMNHYPQITGLTLWTNNRGEGAAFEQNKEEGSEDASQYFAVKSETQGYLNSGFISKNQTIGFGVDTISGNPPLNYRVQYVQRESIVLDHGELDKMANGSNGFINLYTIKDRGDVDNASWARMGVIGNPIEGAHFVYQAGYQEFSRDFSGEVWAYRAVHTTGKTGVASDAGGLNIVDPDDLNFVGGAYFGSGGTRINEFKGSQPDMPNGNTDTGDTNNPAKTAYFLIKVWDTVDESNAANEADMLYDAVVVGMNVFLYDTTPPVIRLYDLNPYTETTVLGNNVNETEQGRTIAAAADPREVGANILRGGLFNVGTNDELIKSGHIEPRNGTRAIRPGDFFADGYESGDGGATFRINTYYGGENVLQDQVSGTVILRGVAWDDQLIRQIQVEIGGGTPVTILELQGPPENRTIQPPTGIRAWAVEDLHWQRGHTVEWAYVWDTETYNGGGPQNVVITVSVRDEKGGDNLGLFNTSAGGQGVVTTATEDDFSAPLRGQYHNQVSVTIAPYIIGFEREKPQFVTKRSRQGWYSFYRNEGLEPGAKGISVLGYNLSGGNVTMGIENQGGTVGMSNILRSTEEPNRRINFAIPAGAQSGRINLRIGTVDVLNHRSNHANQSWNREYHSGTAGSELWINKPHAHIWRSREEAGSGNANNPSTYFGNLSAVGGSAGLSRPAMALEYTGTTSGMLTGVWAIYGNADVYYGRNTNQIRNPEQPENRNRGMGFYSWAANNTTAIIGPPSEPWVGTDVAFFNGSRANGAMVVAYEGDGNAILAIRHGTNFNIATRASLTGNNSSPNPPGNTDGRVVPPVAVSPTKRWMNNRVDRSNAQSHLTSYDSFYKRLQYGRLAGAATTTRNDHNIDGKDVTGSTSTDAGLFSAIDHFDNNRPVVAYYDSANDTLKIAYAGSETPAGPGDWTKREVLSGDLSRGSGRYVSIKVDKENFIHLAFYNTTHNTLVYAKGNTAGAATAFTAYTIDSVVRGGVWTNISVDDNGNPYIVYGDSSRIGNYDGMRLAYRTNDTNGIQFDADSSPASRWEALSVPANYVVNDDRLSVEAWPPTNRAGGGLGAAPGWNAAVGYGSDQFRIAYFFNPNFKGY